MNKQINPVEAWVLLPSLNAMFLKAKGKIDISTEDMQQYFEDPANRILKRYGVSVIDVKKAFQVVGAEMGTGDEEVYHSRHVLKELGIIVDNFNMPDLPAARQVPDDFWNKTDEI